MIREVVTDADFAAWIRIRNTVEPWEAATVEDMCHSLRHEPDLLYLLAELGGEPVGCAFVVSSTVLPGAVVTIPRVLPAVRRRAVGSVLLRAASDRAREVGGAFLRSHVDAADEAGLAFAARYGFEETDRQVELVRTLADRIPEPAPPEGVELVELRPEHHPQAYAIALETMPELVLSEGTVEAGPYERWIEENVSGPIAYGAIAGGALVGFAGVVDREARPGALENTLTAVLRPYRGRGIALALKQALVVWAAEHGYREIYTWTQTGNAAMRAVNEKAGYLPGHVSIVLRGPLVS